MLIGRKLFLPILLVGVALVAQTVYAHPRTSSAPSALRIGASHFKMQRVYQGYYDGHLDTYYNTDVSSRSQAKALHINFAPLLAKTLPKSTSPEYFVTGRAAMHQLAVFGSEPPDPSYSPLWQELMVTWKSGAKVVLLTSDNQILSLRSKGQLKLKRTMVVLNAPIIKVRAAKA